MKISKALSDVTAGKAPGFDNIHHESLINCDKHTKYWLAKFFTDIMQSGNVPPEFKRCKVIALLKPDKCADRPIALLSVIYKLLERLVHKRVSSELLELIPASGQNKAAQTRFCH